MDGLVLQVIAFLVAAIVAPPLFKRLGLGAVVGYLVAGVVIGPFGLGMFDDAASVQTFAQLGVVLLLFVIGLDTRISRLIAMRHDILGLGLGQVAVTTLLLAAGLYLMGLPPAAAAVAGFALALSGTAVALQILETRGDLARPYGQRSFAVLLTQDMLTVPVLALVPIVFLAGETTSRTGHAAGDAALALGVIAAIVLSGRYLLNPLFRILAATGAREVMTAAALLVVLGAALAAGAAGLSMALGAFIAGVMLAGSSYRHQLLADVEPFRGLLLALFFMSVGMLIHVGDLMAAPLLMAGLLAAYLMVKIAAGAGVALVAGASRADAMRIGFMLAAAGEFAFVLAPIVAAAGLVSEDVTGRIIAVAALSMIAAPPLAALGERLLPRIHVREREPEDFSGVNGSVIVIGFGRFGQIAAQMLLSEEVEVTLIDSNPDRIEDASAFGFKVYYGDGARIDILRAAGANEARLILVCLKDANLSLRICEQIRAEFPLLKIYARAYDRTHAIALMEAGIDQYVRDTYESAILCGRRVLEALGTEPGRAGEVDTDVRRRDEARLALQRVQGLTAGIDLMHQKTMRPAPLKKPDRPGRALNPEAEALVSHGEPDTESSVNPPG